MSVDPTQCHYRIANLSFKKFNFTIISHTTLILLPSLRRHNQSVDNKTTLSLNSSQNSACFNKSECVRMCDLKESSNYINRAYDCAKFGFVLKVLTRLRYDLLTLSLIIKVLWLLGQLRIGVRLLGMLKIVILECWLADLWVRHQRWVTWLCQIYVLYFRRQGFWHICVSINLNGRILQNRCSFNRRCGCCLRWCLVICWHRSTEWNIAIIPLGLLSRHQAI